MIVENMNKKSKDSFGEELPPDPSRVAEGLRDTGYDFNTAISDIVDNSIAANATKIDITFNISPMNEISIYIADNGTGMDENGLKNAMKYGSKQRDEIKSLGKFGLGLKTASTAFCRKLSLVTKDKSTTHLLKMTWDLDHIAKVNKWQPIISTPSKDETRIFNSIATDDTGTLVIWEKIDRLLAKNPEELFQEIINNSNKNVDWEKRFEKLNSSEDTTLRNLFKELIDANLIKVYWADNIPYHIEILSNWQTYINKQRHYVDSPKNIFTNNFYGTVTNTQIQQNSSNSNQIVTNNLEYQSKIDDLILKLKEYDSILEKDIGQENADLIRNQISELQQSNQESNISKSKEILQFIKEVFVNASGSLIAAGVIQAIQTLV